MIQRTGVSVCLINTEKGANFFEEIKNKMFFEKRTVEEAVKGNTQLRHPTPKHKNYDLFLKIYSENGLKEAIDKTLI